MGKCLSTENLYGGFVHHVAAVINNPVLTVRGIRIKGNVRNHPQLGKAGFQRSYRILDQPVRIVGFPTIETFDSCPTTGKSAMAGMPVAPVPPLLEEEGQYSNDRFQA